MKKIAQQRRKTRHALIQVAECGLGFNKLGRHVLGPVDLWCTNFGLNGSLLIAKQSCKPSGLS